MRRLSCGFERAALIRPSRLCVMEYRTPVDSSKGDTAYARNPKSDHRHRQWRHQRRSLRRQRRDRRQGRLLRSPFRDRTRRLFEWRRTRRSRRPRLPHRTARRPARRLPLSALGEGSGTSIASPGSTKFFVASTYCLRASRRPTLSLLIETTRTPPLPAASDLYFGRTWPGVNLFVPSVLRLRAPVCGII